MLLLILFAGCLATSVAQTTTVSSALVGTTSAAYMEDYVAILQAYVQYAGQIDLNETTAQPILNELLQLIKLQLPDSGVSLKIRNITKV